jgi:hypothetical protein
MVTVLLVTVVAVFISPAIDLEPTALRASQAAQALQTALLSAAFVLSSLLCLAAPGFLGPICHLRLKIHADLLELNCTRLC